MQFIVMEHGQKASASSRRQAHSHAARVAHARNRRQKEAEYAKEKTLEGESQSQDATTTQIPHPERSDEAATRSKQQAIVQKNKVHFVPRNITGAFEHQTLAQFIQSLTSREQLMFQHYIQVVFPYLNRHCPVLKHDGGLHQRLRNNWVLLSSTDADLLRGFLLAACRHLSLVNAQDEYFEYADQYKLRYIQELRQAVADESHGTIRKAVSMAVVLAFDEIMLGDMQMAGKHVLGALHMVKKAGGIQVLGLNQFLSYLLHTFVHGKRLLDWDPKVNCSASFMKPGTVALSV